LVIAAELVQTARRADVFAVPASLQVVRVLARGGGERELEIVVLRVGFVNSVVADFAGESCRSAEA